MEYRGFISDLRYVILAKVFSVIKDAQKWVKLNRKVKGDNT
jgi:hypothetical protein